MEYQRIANLVYQISPLNQEQHTMLIAKSNLKVQC